MIAFAVLKVLDTSIGVDVHTGVKLQYRARIQKITPTRENAKKVKENLTKEMMRMTETIVVLDKLYKTSSTKKELEWLIGVVTNPDGTATIRTVHGQVGGQLQTTDLLISKGKNIGKVNETTPHEQAMSEAESKWNKQQDKNYSIERGGKSKALSPMLAHTYEDQLHKVTFPSFIQPKLDGIRCIATRTGNEISLRSRQNKEFVGLKHIRDELLQEMRDGESWDGELFNKSLTFQNLVKLVKKDQPDSIKVQYHIYDKIDDDTFEMRTCRFIPEEGKEPFEDRQYLVAVTTLSVKSHEQVMERHKVYIGEGYEGSILRVGDCMYKAGDRSNQLLKVKDWITEEFEIIRVLADVHETQGIFECKTKTGGIFKVRSKGEDSEREYYLQHPEEFIGKMLSTEFFEWTSSEVPLPRFPVGLAIRDYE